MATRIYKTPFAATGDKEALATADQPDGKVSLQAGWTPDYELPNDNANYRPVGRGEMNGVFNELTAALGEVQLMGFAKWQALDGGWPTGAQVNHGGLVYRSLIDSNLTEPGAVGANWVLMGSGIATTAQAQALVDDLVLLTPKKLDDAFMGANQSLGSNSFYQKHPGGLLVQGGNFTAATADFLVTFPIAFVAAPISIVATVAGNSTSLIGAMVDTGTTTNFAVRVRNSTSGVGSQAVDWVAYGRWK
ncbi:gp53-like domain-containing protein [Achromobacter ruhlandii]|uniref:gp53-like domain-containing protein n=1 Tax=Achromobacter ruhlandii TaxID=72557 RepID=UPI003BA2D1AB